MAAALLWENTENPFAPPQFLVQAFFTVGRAQVLAKATRQHQDGGRGIEAVLGRSASPAVPGLQSIPSRY
jgi:hypothetical protein